MNLLAAGRPVHGIFVKLPSTDVIDIVAAAGFDFAIVDREHSSLSEAEALRLVRHARAIGLPALVRLPTFDRGAVNRLLEAGAAGVQLSTTRTAAQVRELVAATRYAPQGERSVGVAHHRAAFGARPLSEYLDDVAADPPLVVVQIETATTDDPLVEILSAGADVAFIGGTDLAVDLGFDDDLIRARTAEIAAAAAEAGIALGGAGVKSDDLVYVANTADIGLLRGAAAAFVGGDGAPAQPRPTVTAQLRTEIEQLLSEFAHRLDLDHGLRVHELFTEDGSYIIDGRPLTGHETIRSGYEQRAALGLRTGRHLFTNVLVQPDTADRVRVQSVLVLYADDGEPILPARPPLVVADFADVCVRREGRWLFETRDLKTVFRDDRPVRSPGASS